MSIIKFESDFPKLGPIIEEIGIESGSIFKDAHIGVLKNICEIINVQQKAEKNKDADADLSDINNIITFMGERGTGKSSALISIRNFLNKLSSNSLNISSMIEKYEQLEPLTDYKFYALRVIDPTKMKSNESIISNISIRLYSEFNKMCKERTRGYDDDDIMQQRRKFLQIVREVNQAAIDYNADKLDYDDDDVLSKMEKVDNLRSNIKTMIEVFMKLKERDWQHDKSYFVIFIDDLDMNITGSYEMLEEIRKFLMIPNVIVILSASMTQLNSVVYEKFAEKLPVKQSGNAGDVVWEARDLAFQYLQKTIPKSHRHEMPILNNSIIAETQIDFGYELFEGSIQQKIKDNNVKTYPTIKELVIHLIHRKTMVILACDKDEKPAIIPRNLRGLYQMLLCLESMDDIAYDSDGNPNNYAAFSFTTGDALRARLSKNIKLMKNYIINHCLEYNGHYISPKDLVIADKLVHIINTISEWPIQSVNAKIVRELISAFDDASVKKSYFGTLKQKETTSRVDPIYSASFHPETISIGDVIFVLGKLSKLTQSQEIRDLISILRLMWSLRATEEFYVKQLKANNGNINDDLCTLIGGFVINPDDMRFFHSEKSDWMDVPVNIDSLKNWLDNLSKKNVSNEPTPTYESYSIFAISYVSTEDDTNNPEWRTYSKGGKRYYSTILTMSDQTAILRCHYFSTLTNLLTPQKMYERIYYSTAPLSNLIESNLNEWFNKFYMILPFYSLDFITQFYKYFRDKNKLNEDETRDCYVAFWNDVESSISMVKEQLENCIHKDFLDVILNAVKDCPIKEHIDESTTLIKLAQDNSDKNNPLNEESSAVVETKPITSN